MYKIHDIYILSLKFAILRKYLFKFIKFKMFHCLKYFIKKYLMINPIF